MDGITAANLEPYEGPLRRFLDEGLLETGEGRLRLTQRGVMLSNEVFQEFLS
jgi:oxygen-independent coproporphyrinogen-3 oxidase